MQKYGDITAIEEDRDALRAELDRKTALYERVTDDFAGEVGSLRAELAEWKATAEHEAYGLESWKQVAEKAEAELAGAREALEKIYPFILKVSKQIAEKPDYWTSCGQCDNNRDEAEELVEIAQAALKEGK